MNRAQTEYAALRYESAKIVSAVTMDVKVGNVIVEQVDYDSFGKRIRKFRCPPGTRRAGKWTNSMGTTCNLGAARATLAKLGERIDQFDNALAASEERRAAGGPGLARYQAGRALERGGQILDFLADRRDERVKLRREKRKERRLERRRKLGAAVEGLGNLIDPAGKDEDKNKEPKVGLTEGDLPTPKKVKKKKTSKKPGGDASTDEAKPTKKPTGPAKAAEANIQNAANVNQVNAGKSGKKKPGKQIGNLFTSEDNAKGKAANLALDTGEHFYVVKTSTGKFRIIDEARFLANDEEVVFGTGPDGVVHDLSDISDLSVAEIVDDLKVQNEIDAALAAAEAIEPPLLVDKSLSKSKTGKFVPDEINANMVGELGEGKTQAFLAAFQEQRERNLSYWNKTLGDNAPDTDSADEFLAAIDGHIATEAGKDTPDAALVGQMTAERKNFLAMWVPNEGEDDVNAYERINFVQPKRRHQIIEDAGLEDLIVAATKTKTKPKQKLALKDDKDEPAITEALPAELEPPLTPDWHIANYKDEGNAATYAMTYSNNTETDVVVVKTKDGLYVITSDDDFDSSVPFDDLDQNFGVVLYSKGKPKYNLDLDFEKYTYKIKPVNEETPSPETEADGPWTPGGKWVTANGPGDAVAQAKSLSAIYGEPVNVVYLQNTGQWFAAPNSEFDPVALIQAGTNPFWPISSYQYDKKWGELSSDLEFTPWTSSAGFSADEPNFFETWADAVKVAETKSQSGPDIVLFQYAGNGTVDMLPLEEFESGINGNSLNWNNPPVAFSDGEPAGYYESGINGVNKFLTEYDGSAPDWDQYGDYGYTPPMSQGQAEHTASDFVLTLQNNYDANYWESDWDVNEEYPDGISTTDLDDIAALEAQFEADVEGMKNEYATGLTQGLSEGEKEGYEYQIMEAYSMLVDIQHQQAVMQELYSKGAVNDVIDDPIDDDLNAPEIEQPDLTPQAALDDLIKSDEYAAFKKQKDTQTKSSTTKNFKPPASITTQEALDAWYADRLALFLKSEENWKSSIASGATEPSVLAAYYYSGDYVAAAMVSLEKQKKIHEKKLKALADAQSALADVVDDNNTIPDGVDLPTVQPVIEADLDAITGNKAAAGIDVLFNLPDYDHQKLYTTESGKMANFATIMARYDKYGAEADELLAKLPDNFHELSPEERLQALIAASPADDQLTAAKRLARSVVANQYGDKASVQYLKDALDGVANGAVAANALSGLDEKIAKHSDELAKAQADLDALGSDVNAVTKLYYEGKVATARNNLVAARMLKQWDTSGSDVQELSSNGKALAAEVDSLPAVIRSDVAKAVNGGIDIKPGSPKTKASKTLMSTEGFDSTSLGSMQPDGSAVAYSIPIGHKGLWSQADADEHVGMGKPLADVPDDYLKEAIWNNTGAGKRFAVIKDGTVHQGFNSMGQSEKDKTTGFLDTVTGKKYVIKSAHRNDQEHTQEIAGALVQQSLGQNAVGIRLGSPIQEVPFEAGPAAKYGKATGDQRAMVLEHVANLYPDAVAVYTSFHDIPAGSQVDPESLARLMVMDRVFNYFDRTGPNLVAVQRPDGKIHLHPIDHGNAFQDWKASGTEQAAGFTKVTKGDNINLMALTKSMSDEDKEIFARAMADAVRRYKKTDYGTVFAKAAKDQKLSGVETERLAKHAEWLTERKESLDWDKMSVSAISQLGFDDDKVAELLAPPNAGSVVEGFGLPSSATTVANVKSKVDEMLVKQANVIMNYDSDQVQNFDVRVQPIRFKSLNTDKTKFTEGTQLTFKRRGDAAELIPSEADGWIKLPTQGTPSPKWGASGTATLNFNAISVAPGTDAYTPTQTWYKELDDGTIVTVVQSTYPPELRYRAATHDSVRIIIPGKSDALTEDRIAKAMTEVGVTKHGAPSDDDIRAVALRSTLSMMSATKDLDDIESVSKRLADEHGITEDMFRTRTFPNGRVSMELTPAAAQVLADSTDKKVLYHQLQDHSDATILSILTQGELLPSVRRWENAVRGRGLSTPQDLNSRGGGDWLYFYKDNQGNTAETLHYSTHHFYTVPGIAFRRTDFHAYDEDAWGDPSIYQPFTKGMSGSKINEVDFLGGFDLSQGILVLPEGKRDAMIAEVKALGRDDIGGIPIEELIATPSTARDQMLALIARYNEDL